MANRILDDSRGTPDTRDALQGETPMESNDRTRFYIEVEMKDRWIPYFMSMLQRMQYLGNIGSSRPVTFFSDGDGDFQPKFNADIDWEYKEPREDGVFDAG